MKNKRCPAAERFLQLRNVLRIQSNAILLAGAELDIVKPRKGDGIALVGAEDLRLGAHVVVPVGADAHAERRAAHRKQHRDDGAEKVIHQKMQREPRRVLPRQASFLHGTPPSELNHTEHSIDTLIIYSKCRFAKREMKNRPKKNKEQRALGLRGALSLDKFPKFGYTIWRKAGSLHESVMKNAASNIRFLSHRQRPKLKPG